MKKRILIIAAVLSVLVVVCCAVISASASITTPECDECVFGTGAFSAICSKCGYVCPHDDGNALTVDCDANGNCLYCNSSCSLDNHLWSLYSRYESFGSGGHMYVVYCSGCNGIVEETEIPYHSNERNEYELRYAVVDDSLHEVLYCCVDCYYVYKSVSHEHNYVNGVCSYCHWICGHSEFYDGECVYCGYACTHAKRTKVCIPMSNYHAWVYVCDYCGFEQHDSFGPCTYTQASGNELVSTCTSCKGFCQHNFNNSVCDCGYTCIHKFTRDVTNNVETLDCAVCDAVYGPFYNPQGTVNLFRRVPFVTSWNMNNGVLQVDNKSYSVDVPYVRYTIVDFNHNSNHSASVTVCGSMHGIDNVGSKNYSPYVVIRMRKSEIRNMGIHLGAYDEVVNGKNYTTTDCSSWWVSLSTLPDDKFVNVVVDLRTLSASNSAYYTPSANDTFSYLRMTLVYNYLSDSGYVDIDFVALIDAKSQLDIFLTSDSGDMACYYLYEGGAFELVMNTHSYQLNVDESGSTCKWCGDVCKHRMPVYTSWHDNEHCGTAVSCERCPYSVVEDLKAHDFTGNVVDCNFKCGFSCNHDYYNGVCRACKWTCTHNFEDGHIKCIHCRLYLESPTYNDDDGFYKLIASIYDAQSKTFFSLLGYEVLGVHIAGFVMSLVTLGVGLIIIKKVI